MATTIDRAEAKLAAKIPGMPGNYNDAMTGFFGKDVSRSIPVASYKAKVAPGMEKTWRSNLERAFGV